MKHSVSHGIMFMKIELQLQREFCNLKFKDLRHFVNIHHSCATWHSLLLISSKLLTFKSKTYNIKFDYNILLSLSRTLSASNYYMHNPKICIAAMETVHYHSTVCSNGISMLKQIMSGKISICIRTLEI